MNRARDQAAAEKSEYRIIGMGTAGTVFEIPGSELAVKKGPNVEALWNDFHLTNGVHNSVAQTREILQDLFPDLVIPKVPSCRRFLMPDSSHYWDANLERFPDTHRLPGAAFEVDRILPIPQSEREKIIDRYFEQDSEIQEEAKNDQGNKNCLIRVYLGENESDARAEEPYDSLENFPMRLNMLEEHLVEDVSILAKEMGLALAVIHWHAQVDGQDCESVLGRSLAAERLRPWSLRGDRKPRELGNRIFNRREIDLWVLDFDKALDTELSSKDVDTKLINAFFGNDPYYPRPDVDEDLWEDFVGAYLKASQAILGARPDGANVMGLPERFIRKVVAKVEADKDWDPEKDIVFK